MSTPQKLSAFLDAWNAHDVETIVSYFTPDGVIGMSGADRVFASRTFHGVSPHGQPMTYRGVDLFVFEADRFAVKDADRKERSSPIGGRSPAPTTGAAVHHVTDGPVRAGRPAHCNRLRALKNGLACHGPRG